MLQPHQHNNGAAAVRRLCASSSEIDAAFVPTAEIEDWAAEIGALVFRHGCAARLERIPLARQGDSAARLVVTTWPAGGACCEGAAPQDVDGIGWRCAACGSAVTPAELVEVDLSDAWALLDNGEEDGVWLPLENAVAAAVVEDAWHTRLLGSPAVREQALSEA